MSYVYSVFGEYHTVSSCDDGYVYVFGPKFNFNVLPDEAGNLQYSVPVNTDTKATFDSIIKCVSWF